MFYFDVFLLLCRRNEGLMGTRASIGKQPGAFTIIGDDPKKYAAAMMEYTKEKVRNLLHINQNLPVHCYTTEIQ